MTLKTFFALFSLLWGLNAQAQTCNPNIVKTKPDSQYTVSADGTEVTDTKTGLIWQRCALGMSWNGTTCGGTATNHIWEDALAQAATVATNTNVAWRLPNIKELKSLVEAACYGQAINETIFPATPSSIWSSSADAYLFDVAWKVSFYDGFVNWGDEYDGLAVRPVRSQ